MLSLVCLFCHKSFGAEAKWKCIAQQKLERSDVKNPVALFMGAKIATWQSRGYNIDAFNHNSSVRLTFKKGEQEISGFKIEGYRLYLPHPLHEKNNKMHLYVLERATNDLYKCSFELVLYAQAPAEAKE